MNQNMQGMIYGGAFGSSGPMNLQGFNPYQNNMIPFGNYNQPMIQPQEQYQYYNNNLYGSPQPQNNGLVFQPVGGYQPPSPYGNYNQQQGNYYNPYGNTFNQSPYGQNGYSPYGNSYSYSNYGGYRPFISPVAMQQYQNQQIELFKIKYRMANHYVGNDINEDYLDKLCNPNNPIYQKTEEERMMDEEQKFIQYVSAISSGKIQTPRSYIQRQADMINLMSYNKHQALDKHSLCEFLEEDLWKLQREEWIRENINVHGDRNLSAVYNSSDFNELLKLHNSSSSPYISDLLNNSRYDNNLDDIEVGMNIAFEKEKRRKAILEGKVPEFISSDETQKRRHEWTQQLMNQIYRKGSGANV